MISVDYETAMMVGKLRKKIRLGNSKKIDISYSDTDPKIIVNMYRNMKSLDVIPDSSNLVFETIPTESIVVIHSTLGSKINNTLGSLLSTFLSSKTGYIIETRSNPYRILLSSVNIRLRQNHIFSLFDDEFDVESGPNSVF